jgi:hypothetical protein
MHLTVILLISAVTHIFPNVPCICLVTCFPLQHNRNEVVRDILAAVGNASRAKQLPSSLLIIGVGNLDRPPTIKNTSNSRERGCCRQMNIQLAHVLHIQSLLACCPNTKHVVSSTDGHMCVQGLQTCRYSNRQFCLQHRLRAQSPAQVRRKVLTGLLRSSSMQCILGEDPADKAAL